MVTQNSSNQPFQSNKGDLIVGTGSGGRPAILPVATNGLAIVADSTQTTGLNYSSITNPVLSSFTPSIIFGVGSTGITYLQQNGTSVVIGNLCFVTGVVQLLTKGSSIGGAAIIGLPQAPTGVNAICFVQSSFITFDAGYTYLSGDFYNNSGAGGIMLDEVGSGLLAQNISNSNFMDNSLIYFTGFYQIS